MLRMYHGTTSKNLDKLIKTGSEKLYLTMDEDQAQYYAECASEDDESEPKIIVVEICESMLFADTPSFDEPLTYILNYNNSNESEWHEAINSGEIKYPSIKDWKTSLKYTKNVIAIGNIKPEQILGEDASLTEEDIKRVELLFVKVKKMKS